MHVLACRPGPIAIYVVHTDARVAYGVEQPQPNCWRAKYPPRAACMPPAPAAPAGPYVRSLAALPAETTRGPRCGAVESSFARARFAFGAGVAEAPSARLVGCWARRKSVCVWVCG